MIFQKPIGKTIFKPSFGAKKGTTNFHHAIINNKVAGEIEVNPLSSKYGKPEIMSLYTEMRGIGAGRFLVNKTIETYLIDELYVNTTKDSKPFWMKMGAIEFNGDMCVFKKH